MHPEESEFPAGRPDLLSHLFISFLGHSVVGKAADSDKPLSTCGPVRTINTTILLATGGQVNGNISSALHYVLCLKAYSLAVCALNEAANCYWKLPCALADGVDGVPGTPISAMSEACKPPVLKFARYSSKWIAASQYHPANLLDRRLGLPIAICAPLW
jgi:hypothetical protein